MGARFTLTQKQVRDLIAMTPDGYTAQVTVSFRKDEDRSKLDGPKKEAEEWFANED